MPPDRLHRDRHLEGGRRAPVDRDGSEAVGAVEIERIAIAAAILPRHVQHHPAAKPPARRDTQHRGGVGPGDEARRDETPVLALRQQIEAVAHVGAGCDRETHAGEQRLLGVARHHVADAVHLRPVGRDPGRAGKPVQKFGRDLPVLAGGYITTLLDRRHDRARCDVEARLAAAAPLLRMVRLRRVEQDAPEMTRPEPRAGSPAGARSRCG